MKKRRSQRRLRDTREKLGSPRAWGQGGWGCREEDRRRESFVIVQAIYAQHPVVYFTLSLRVFSSSSSGGGPQPQSVSNPPRALDKRSRAHMGGTGADVFPCAVESGFSLQHPTRGGHPCPPLLPPSSPPVPSPDAFLSNRPLSNEFVCIGMDVSSMSSTTLQSALVAAARAAV
ncbi:hypothetical protein LZ30DRAFT_156374 [Colletotrichum cereale]|nr:hypothetical protein LZ30DRAFT_156374 [Colletotrichum cereale]